MNVLLVNPPYWTGGKKPLGYTNLSTIPLGLCYIAAALELDGLSPAVLDMNILGMKTEELKERVAGVDPLVVGITSMTCNYPNAVKAAEAVKSVNPEALVVVGGVHATFLHRETLETVPEIDVVARYEGEYTMRELVETASRGGDLGGVKGITYREDGEIVSTQPRAPIEDLDALPFPAHHLLEPSVEKYIEIYGVRNFPVITSRGCPFECIYCSTAAFHGRKYRTREMTKVVDEIEYVVDRYNVTNVSFVDDNFTMQNSRVFKLCEELERRDLSLEWGCSARVDQVTRELLEAMKGVGCNDVFYGIESASQEVLDIVKKGFSVQQAKDAVRMTEELNIRSHCSFIINLPGETVQSLGRMIEFVEETRPSGRALPNLLEVLPGTELYARKEEYSRWQPIPDADITKTQIEMLLAFWKINFGIDELYRVIPPNIMLSDPQAPASELETHPVT